MADHKKDTGEKLLSTNSHAHHNYFIEELIEAGMVLTGTEIKSMRAQAPNIRDAYVEISGRAGALEAFLVNAHIGPYAFGNIWNHEPNRRRKLLLHRNQIEKLFGAIKMQGMSLVPTRIYLSKGRAKIEIGLGKGKKKSDKRETLKQKTASREMDQAMKRGKQARR